MFGGGRDPLAGGREPLALLCGVLDHLLHALQQPGRLGRARGLGGRRRRDLLEPLGDTLSNAAHALDRGSDLALDLERQCRGALGGGAHLRGEPLHLVRQLHHLGFGTPLPRTGERRVQGDERGAIRHQVHLVGDLLDAHEPTPEVIDAGARGLDQLVDRAAGGLAPVGQCLRVVLTRCGAENRQRLFQLAAQPVQLAHGGEQCRRLDETTLGLTRGVAGLAKRSGNTRADLPRGSPDLVARLLEMPHSALQRFRQRRERSGSDAGALPAIGVGPALERSAHHRELRADQAQLLAAARDLPLMREQGLDLLRETGEFTPAGARGQPAQIGDPAAGETVRQPAQVTDDPAVEPESERDTGEDTDRGDGGKPGDEDRKIEPRAGSGVRADDPPHAGAADQRPTQATQPDAKPQTLQ